MGRPSNRKRSAQRPGKRERARVKRHRRAKSTLFVGGGDTFTLKAGRKKWTEAHLSNNPENPWGLHSRGVFAYVPIMTGKHTLKVVEQAKRPLYEAGAGSEPARCH